MKQFGSDNFHIQDTESRNLDVRVTCLALCLHQSSCSLPLWRLTESSQVLRRGHVERGGSDVSFPHKMLQWATLKASSLKKFFQISAIRIRRSCKWFIFFLLLTQNWLPHPNRWGNQNWFWEIKWCPWSHRVEVRVGLKLRFPGSKLFWHCPG